MREKAEKPAKRKLTRAERKQIEAVIRQAKGDGKTHTVQDSIPFQNMFPDGLCRLEGGTFSKTIAFEDVNYRLAGPEDQQSIFESLCDFYNGYDPSIGVQVSLDSRSGGSAADEMFGITRQGNDLDPIRDEAVDILRMQYKRGNNGYVKTKYVTLTIEAENLPAARARFARIETDTLNRFKVMGAAAHVLDGKERLELLYNILHPEGGQFAFEWDWLPASGLSVKDFISPSSFHFGETRTFRIGRRYGAVSFLQILAPEMHDRMLIVQDAVWNTVTINRAIGRSTWYFVDEFHLLLKEEQTAAYSAEIWKRFRKWGGIPTGATQNPKDLLSSPEIENILENSDFIYMLNQAAGDRKILAERLNISSEQLAYCWLLPTSFLPSMRKTGSSPARWNGCGRKQISMTPLSMKKTAPISGLRRRNCKSGNVRFAVS